MNVKTVKLRKNLLPILSCLLLLAARPSKVEAMGFGVCPSHALANNEDRALIEFLRKYEGKGVLGSCKVELHVCQDTGSKDVISPVDESGAMVADMLIIDAKGFERYVPFYVPSYEVRSVRQNQKLTDQALFYRFRDKNFDPASGKYEKWAIEFVKNWGKDDLSYIEIGYWSQTEKESDVPKKWIICGSEREEYVRRHPLMHRLKSWWHWLRNR